jgi:hypothetical protein
LFRALLFLSPLAFGALALVLGQDGSWDLRNYHFYNPWAFLHGRMDVDVAPAHNATFYNPLLHLPFYYAVTQLPPRAVAFLLGTVQGMNLWLLYGIARGLSSESRRATALLLAAAGTLGAGNLAELGTSFGDNVVSLPVLGALALILRHVKSGRSAWMVPAAGLLAGIAAGMKLPAAIFAVGLCAGFMVLPWPGRERLRAAFVFGVGVLIGVALADGFWLLEMWRRFGNPLFPYFNDVFQSPWAAPAGYRDPRFLPDGWIEWLAFPLVLLFDPRQGGEVPFLDLRLPVLYIAVLALAFVPLRRERAIESGATGRYLLVAGVVAYVLWLKMFAIHRYALVFEMLAPLGVWLAIRALIVDERRRRIAVAISVTAMLLVMKPADWDRVAFSADYFGVTIPAIPKPERTLVLMADHDATAYLIPFFPSAVRFLRIDGYFTGPSAMPHEYDRVIRRAIHDHQGDIYLLVRSWEQESAARALQFHDMATAWPSCTRLKPALDAANPGDLLFCATHRAGLH